MALLEIYIGKSKYTIDCEESQRDKITNLASHLNERVNNLSLKMRSADEKTILMLCCVMIEEELEDLKNLKSSPHNNQNERESLNKENEQQNISKSIQNATLRIENLANKIKNY